MKLNTETSAVQTLHRASAQRSTRSQIRRSRAASQRLPKWAYLLFILLAGFVTYRIFQHRATEGKAAQPAPRPASVAKVITKDVPLYLDEIGTCAAYETVQVQAQVSGVILQRHFQDGSEVKKGDLLFTIDPRPYQAVLDQAKAQAALDQVTLKRQEDLRARKVIAQQDYDTALANAQKSQAAVEAAQVNFDYSSSNRRSTGELVFAMLMLATWSDLPRRLLSRYKAWTPFTRTSPWPKTICRWCENILAVRI